jgi:Phage portal protein, SPP1 Gp6-like
MTATITASAAPPPSPSDDPARLAAELIGTKFLPPGLSRMTKLADEADAYHALNPYPRFALANWKTEDLGPLPRCLPLAKDTVNRGAKWLFGRPIQIHCAGNKALEGTLRDAWTRNKMEARMVAASAKAAREGGLFLKYAIDERNKERPITIQTLSIIDDVRLYYHPHDNQQLLMVRVQYPYFDATTGAYWWYREEWTDQEEIHYRSIRDQRVNVMAAARDTFNPDTYEGWEIDAAASKPNPFGRIPGVHIKNLETDDTWGAADLWSLFDENHLYRTLDKMNLAFYLMDISNQYDSRTNPVYIDAILDNADIDKPLQPGQPISLSSEQGSDGHGRQARVEFPSGTNQAREPMRQYFLDLRQMFYIAASTVEFTPENFTNKGNLTAAVLQLIFQPQIEMTEEKHKSYGQNGIEPFLENLARGAQAAGIRLGVKDDPESYDVTLKWSPYFVLSEDEKTARVARIQQEEIANYTTHERAIEAVALIEGVEDVEVLQGELEKERQEEVKETPPTTPNAESSARSGNPTAPTTPGAAPMILPDMKAAQPGAVPFTNRPL